MSKTRSELHELLKEVLGSDNVYFQPPENIKMKYPCIRYSRNPSNVLYADNAPYRIKYGYEIILIDKNPDTEIFYKLCHLPMCRHERHYNADGLNHDVFYIYC